MREDLIDPNITVEKVARRIRDGLARSGYHRRRSGVSGSTDQAEPSLQGLFIEERRIDKFLRKYGLKYAAFIKRVPVLRTIAENHYWRLETNWNCRGFLEQTKREGLKGKVKLIIFWLTGCVPGRRDS
ncbi:MAG: hypothetical protein ABR903_06015 [Thermodesulfovibrionales bacterium]|jgi:hypothetical protein